MRVQDLIGFSQESDRLVVSVPAHRYQEFLALVSSNNAFVIKKGMFYNDIIFHVPIGNALVNHINKLNKPENQYNPDYLSEFPPLDISIDSQQRFYELLIKLINKEHRDIGRKPIGFNF